MNSFLERITIAGFGGQGIMLAGKLLAQTAMKNNLFVTCMASYGAEVRGGTANCMVTISSDPIANPVVIEPDTLIVLNKASFDKFIPKIKTAGLAIINSSRIEKQIDRQDIQAIIAPIDDIALELGNIRIANMTALGIYLQNHHYLQPQMAIDCLGDMLAQRYHNMLKINADAINSGAQYLNNLTAKK